MVANVILAVRKYESIENERLIVADILSNIELNLNFIDNREFDTLYNKDKWQLMSYNSFEYFDYPLKKNPEPKYLNRNSIKIFIGNSDFISFQGPDHYFNQWWSLHDSKNKKSTEGWRNVFKEVAVKYGLNEIIYTSEWGLGVDAIYEGDATFVELYNLLIEGGKRKDEFYGLDSAEYFLEKVNGKSIT